MPESALHRSPAVSPASLGDQHDRVMVVDFGSQYTQLIARKIREVGVFCEIVPHNLDRRELDDRRVKGLILSGGPETLTKNSARRIPDWMLDSRLAVLGICYGMQAFAQQLGGTVASSPLREFGHASLKIQKRSQLLAGTPEVSSVWMSHGDEVVRPPPGFTVLASTASAHVAAMEDPARGRYGVQFHPEVAHTECGARILRNFAVDICGCVPTWKIGDLADGMVGHARETIGNDRVLLALSGGVDSSVVAALLSRAIGDRLTAVFVDNGLLRKNERQEVEQTFSSAAHGWELCLECVDAQTLFLDRLKGMTEPELKRKAIGSAFIRVFEQYAKNHSAMVWLAQGTIYPDVVESAATRFGNSQVIKSHHNVGGLPERLGLKLFEPLRELFKDEVRELGAALGLPEALLRRHPFPGPGLGVRVIGEVTEERLKVLREADAIYISELREYGLYDRVAQAFAVLLPVKSVGVIGDARRYDPVISLRAVETGDFMTAKAAALPWEFVRRVASRIVNEVAGVSRVLLDVSSKPPATIEWE